MADLVNRYDHEQCRLRVRDDGKGIDCAVLYRQGCEGHSSLHLPEHGPVLGSGLSVPRRHRE